jgi:hypothetical protein
MAYPFPVQGLQNISAAVIINSLLQIFRVAGQENDIDLAVDGSQFPGQLESVHSIIQFNIQKGDGYGMDPGKFQRIRSAAEADDTHIRKFFLQHADVSAEQKRDILNDDNAYVILRFMKYIQQFTMVRPETIRQPDDHTDIRKPGSQFPHGDSASGYDHHIGKLLL